eukprot:15460672-Alexandrium_andersonii.AAC.1
MGLHSCTLARSSGQTELLGPEPQATEKALLGGGPAHVQPGHCMCNSALPHVQQDNAAHAEPVVL